MSLTSTTPDMAQAADSGPSRNLAHKRKSEPTWVEDETGGQESSCAACRKLKLKCDRKVPCGTCTKRGWPFLCPNKVPADHRTLLIENEKLTEKIQLLELKLSNLETVFANENNDVDALPAPMPPVTTLREAGDEFNAIDLSINRRGAVDQASKPMQLDHRMSTAKDSSLDGMYGFNNYGTLEVESSSHRSRYFGPTATGPWLKTREEPFEEDLKDSSPEDRLELSFLTEPYLGMHMYAKAPTISLNAVIDILPNLDAMETKFDSYFQLFAWSGSSVIRSDLTILAKTFKSKESPGWTDSPKTWHDVALISIVLAMGTLMDLELEPNHPSARQWCSLSQYCLAHGDYVSCNTISSVQTLSIMGRLASLLDVPGGAEMGYHIRGHAMRAIVGMGLHRDGERWSLSESDLNKRRRLFWDVFVLDVITSAEWARPGSLDVGYVDVKFPDDFGTPNLQNGHIYMMNRCQLAYIIREISDRSLKDQRLNTDWVSGIWQKLYELEANIPYPLRCRAALTATVSKYQSQAAVERDSPEPSRRDTALAFQQHRLAIDLSLSMISLLRPLFIHSLLKNPSNALPSAASLTVIERCGIIIAVLNSLYDLLPRTALRQWPSLLRALPAAECLAGLVILRPSHALNDLSMQHLESMIRRFEFVSSTISHHVLRSCLQWLYDLQDRAKAKRSQAATPQANSGEELEDEYLGATQPPQSGTMDKLMLLGWTTRLVQAEEKISTSPSSNLQTLQPSSGSSEDRSQTFDFLAPDAFSTLFGSSLPITQSDNIELPFADMSTGPLWEFLDFAAE